MHWMGFQYAVLDRSAATELPGASWAVAARTLVDLHLAEELESGSWFYERPEVEPEEWASLGSSVNLVLRDLPDGSPAQILRLARERLESGQSCHAAAHQAATSADSATLTEAFVNALSSETGGVDGSSTWHSGCKSVDSTLLLLAEDVSSAALTGSDVPTRFAIFYAPGAEGTGGLGCGRSQFFACVWSIEWVKDDHSASPQSSLQRVGDLGLPPCVPLPPDYVTAQPSMQTWLRDSKLDMHARIVDSDPAGASHQYSGTAVLANWLRAIGFSTVRIDTSGAQMDRTCGVFAARASALLADAHDDWHRADLSGAFGSHVVQRAQLLLSDQTRVTEGLRPNEVMRLCELWRTGTDGDGKAAPLPVGYLMGACEIAEQVVNDIYSVAVDNAPELSCRVVIGNCEGLNASPGHAVTLAYSISRRVGGRQHEAVAAQQKEVLTGTGSGKPRGLCLSLPLQYGRVSQPQQQRTAEAEREAQAQARAFSISVAAAQATANAAILAAALSRRQRVEDVKHQRVDAKRVLQREMGNSQDNHLLAILSNSDLLEELLARMPFTAMARLSQTCGGLHTTVGGAPTFVLREHKLLMQLVLREHKHEMHEELDQVWSEAWEDVLTTHFTDVVDEELGHHLLRPNDLDEFINWRFTPSFTHVVLSTLKWRANTAHHYA